LCGVKNKISSSLKKSSFTAVSCINRVITDGVSKTVLADYFFSLDHEEYKEMKLYMHLNEKDKKKSEPAFKLCSFIKDNRTFFAVSSYIENVSIEKKFLK
jgi:hypothetical protein